MILIFKQREDLVPLMQPGDEIRRLRRGIFKKDYKGYLNMLSTNNPTPYISETYPAQDKDGKPLAVTVIKATFGFSAKGEVGVAGKQVGLWMGDEYVGAAGVSSVRYGSDLSPEKTGTDIVLNGHAYAPMNRPVPRLQAGLKVGRVSKAVTVTGDRFWQVSMGMVSATKPVPFVKMPLSYERAFGGEDRFHDSEKKWQVCKENPVGTGFRVRRKKEAIDGLKLPNIEHPKALMRKWNDQPPPTGFGFVAPFWEPRASLCGTYSKAWENERRPLLPMDFDPKFYNAAHPDLIVQPFLSGNETVHLSHVHPDEEKITFKLPGIQPMCSYIFEHQTFRRKPVLDTLVIEPDEHRFIMVFRCSYNGKEKLSDMKQVNVYED